MSMDWNDPRLTAYALGELEGDELKEMEALVRESKEAREYVREVRETANVLSSELKSEPIPQIQKAKEPARPWWKMQILNPYFSMAVASVAAILLVWPMVREKLEHEPAEPEMLVTQTEPPVVEEAPSLPDNPTPIVSANKTKPKAESQTVAAAPPPTEKADALAESTEPALADAGQPPAQVIAAAPERKERVLRQREMPAKGALMMAKKVSPGSGFGTVGGAGFMPSGTEMEANDHNTESYAHIAESDFVRVGDHPLSTFSIDVDTASYSNVRRFLNSGSLPPPDAVRIEEMINYFPYSYAPPKDNRPFAVHVEQSQTPWQTAHKLVRIGLKGKEIDMRKRPKSNLVFLLDVSGSMNDENKLPLLKNALKAMVDKFTDNDRVAIVVYAGASGLVLPPTSNKNQILEALEKLESGGSTNGGEGIELAYRIAQANFIEGGTNRVILATDGDFNVGTTNEGDLVRLIEDKARSKIFLTVLGFGSGNYKDSTMEKLADKGNGNYAYIDTLHEAKKSLVEQMGATLVTIAKDVKIQVEFNPKFVSAYRLIGYENRKLNKEDFNDDAKDAGEIGAGHTVTALYEIVPAGVEVPAPAVDSLKYAKTKPAETPAADDASTELLTVKLRYKKPEGDKSQLMEVPVRNENRRIEGASDEMKFTAGVAAFGMLLRDSKWKGDADFRAAKRLIVNGVKTKYPGYQYRRELVDLVGKAEKLKKKNR